MLRNCDRQWYLAPVIDAVVLFPTPKCRLDLVTCFQPTDAAKNDSILPLRLG
jgi:hypothetical protein